MKKWINNVSLALWMTAALATGTAFAQTPSAAASAATAASLLNRLDPRRDAAQDMAQCRHVRLDADGKRLSSPGTGALEAENDNNKRQTLAFLKQDANGADK